MDFFWVMDENNKDNACSNKKEFEVKFWQISLAEYFGRILVSRTKENIVENLFGQK